MARLVPGILAVCVLWWFWQVFSVGPATAGTRQLPIEPAHGQAWPSRPGKQPAEVLKAQEPAPQSNGPEQQGPADGPKPPVPLRLDFHTLTATAGDQRLAVARVLLQRAAAAQDVPALLALLGERNAFLHSAEGRRVARQTLARALRQPPERAVAHLGELLARCMRGSIRPSDVEAKKLVNEIYQRHKPLVRRVVFNPERLEGARRYRVKAGDSLGGIASRVRRQGIRLDAHTLALVNRISNPNLVREGQLLKIPVRSLRAVLEKRSFLMAIYLGDSLIRLYWVGHGTEDRTPEATFTVGAKLKHPDWYAPDGNRYAYGHPKNVLGDYFVKFEHPSFTGFGAHGTQDVESIGRMVSQGCIRMLEPDIREFFEIMPQGCQLEIRSTP